jgi:hypothetical protein
VPEDFKHPIVPVCIGCGKTPDQIEEYIEMAEEQEKTANEIVLLEEGTYNRKNGHFVCTLCYIDMGMPSSPTGWIAP